VLCRTRPAGICEWCGDHYPDAVSLSELIALAEADFLTNRSNGNA